MYDPQKHNELVEKYVVRYSYNHTEREELRQEAYISLWRAREIPDESLERFIADAVQNAITKVRPDVLELPLYPDAFPYLPAILKSEWENVSTERLYAALAKLTDSEKTVVTMIFGIGCEPRSKRKTIKDLGRTDWWVRKQEKSALKKLKRILSK